MGTRILVVDDNRSILRMVCDFLVRRGYEVEGLAESEGFEAALGRIRPHLILMDVHMPSANGLELARRVKSDPATASTIVLAFTASAMKEDEVRARDAGCDGYISKPFRLAGLLETLESFLGHARDPAPAPGPQEQVAEPAASSAGGSASGTVLVIEDNPSVRRLTSSILGTRWRIVSAAEGAEGLELLRREHPDLVITDVTMPGLTGCEVCARIKADPLTRNVPVILMTATGDEDELAELAATGADDVIQKPFQSRELLARVAAQMERRPRAGTNGCK